MIECLQNRKGDAFRERILMRVVAIRQIERISQELPKKALPEKREKEQVVVINCPHCGNLMRKSQSVCLSCGRLIEKDV
jgi:rubrerythrin